MRDLTEPASATTSPPAVRVRSLRKRYGDVLAVDGVDLDVAQGEIFGLIGPNGCGKTTTVESIEGLRRADGGEVRVLGLDPVTQGPALRQRIGCQLQESSLPERIRVSEALTLFASLAAHPVDWRRLLRDWGLDDKRDASFASLSGGQRQRLFIALALVNGPEVLFLDEMTTGLDPAARRVAWELVEVLRAQGMTVVLVTHFMEEAERLCDRVAVMHRGRVVAQGTPSDLAVTYGGGVRLTFSVGDRDVGFLEQVPDVETLRLRGSVAEVRGHGAVLPRVAAALVDHGIVPTDMRVDQPTLEDAFLALTGEE